MLAFEFHVAHVADFAQFRASVRSQSPFMRETLRANAKSAVPTVMRTAKQIQRNVASTAVRQIGLPFYAHVLKIVRDIDFSAQRAYPVTQGSRRFRLNVHDSRGRMPKSKRVRTFRVDRHGSDSIMREKLPLCRFLRFDRVPHQVAVLEDEKSALPQIDRIVRSILQKPAAVRHLLHGRRSRRGRWRRRDG